ncbi:uncharacterized protein LOC107039660 [Diachasma alloeum]|uniref:uncharacterized protein LOC107039660 n=1 Tax=Diachasma alloeum TaxID=454923 RepID=UPI00073850C6|nr:uncharacterized protein LOC107039660 [Diachasma alloeum]
MATIIFFISIAVIVLAPSCYSIRMRSRLNRGCMFGPFENNAMKCINFHGKMTTCMLQDLDWFSQNDYLSIDQVLDSCSLYTKQNKYKRRVEKLMKRCVKKANRNGDNREERGNEFITCLNAKNAFAAIFPWAFCEKEEREQEEREQEETQPLVSSDTLLNDMPECGDNKTTKEFTTCWWNSSGPDPTNSRVIPICIFGPFKKNAVRCLPLHRKIDSCFLNGLDYFTKDHKIDITKVLDSIQPYVVNRQYMEEIDEDVKRCVAKANSIRGTSTEVALVNCLFSTNTFTHLHDAFCPKGHFTGDAVGIQLISPKKPITNNYMGTLGLVLNDAIETFFRVITT